MIEYQIDKKNYRIEVEGNTDEIRKLLYSCYSVLAISPDPDASTDEKLKNLESITDSESINFPDFTRVYYSKKSLLILPNAHSEKEKKFRFNFIIKNFKKALQLSKNLKK